MLRNGYTQTMTYNPLQPAHDRDRFLCSPTRIHIFQWHSLHCYDPDGLVLTYGYNSIYYTNDQLASVSYSTSPVTSQHYLYQNSNQPYALTSVQDENGATYRSWTYDGLGRGLTSQMAARRI